MKTFISFLVVLAIVHCCNGGPLRLQKRAAFYIANETACVVDHTVYSNGDPIPTDDPCESCKCRPPGFACVLKDCQAKPGCRAVRRAGHCCPDYICGCEHNGRMYRDGDEIRDSENPCYTCHCQGSSIACAFVDCFFRVDCAPVYVPGECCPSYTNCNETVDIPYSKDSEANFENKFVPSSVVFPGVTYVEDSTQEPDVGTTIIEIFEAETDKPELLQLDPEAVDLYAVVDEESSDVREGMIIANPEESPEIKEDSGIKPTTVTSAEIKVYSDSSSEEEESNPDTEVESKQDEPDTEISADHSSTLLIESPASSSDSDVESEVEQKANLELSTEALPQPEYTHSPLVEENINVEPEEPSNTLESVNSASDYGKSLRFPEQDEVLSSTEIEETIVQDSKTEQPNETVESSTEVNTDESSTAAKIQVFAEIVSTNMPVTEEQSITSDSTEKNLYYDGKENLQADPVETVTTLIIVEDANKSLVTNETEAVSLTETENLFKSNDKLEADDSDKLIAPVLGSNEQPEIKEDIRVEIVETTPKNDITTAKVLEKIESDDSTVSTTNSQTDVTVTTTDIQ